MDIFTLKKTVEEFESYVEEENKNDEKYFELEHEVLRDALTKQVSLQLKWENILSTVNYVYYETETYTDAAYSKAVKDILDNSNIDYSITEAKIIAQNDTKYIETKLLFNRILVVRKTVEGFLEALKVRNWSLKSITELVIRDIDKHLI